MNFFREKIIASCVSSREFLLNWDSGKRKKITVNNIPILISEIDFEKLSDEDLWAVFLNMNRDASSPRG